MTIDRKTFFADVRQHLFGGFLKSSQVDGIGRILDEWDRRKLTDLRWLAYMLATTFHETGRAMVPVPESGSAAYLRSKPYWPWIGEGLVQVTWEANARKFGATKPGDCMSWPVALSALFDGMIKGMFTGRRLAQYFHGSTSDAVGARHIINGTDRASLIASYHYALLHALIAASQPTASDAMADKPKPAEAA